MWFEHFEILNKFKTKNKYFLTNIFIIKIVAIIVDNYEKIFNKFNKKFFLLKNFRKRFLNELKNKIICFDVKKTNKLFRYHNANYKINLISKIKSVTKKVYDLTKNQIFVMKVYVNEMLKKNLFDVMHQIMQRSF